LNLGLDLDLDSFAWIELTIALQDRLGVTLTETDSRTAAGLRGAQRRRGRLGPS
jgi:acyl carrier protein